jgi:hypothetical protein
LIPKVWKISSSIAGERFEARQRKRRRRQQLFSRRRNRRRLDVERTAMVLRSGASALSFNENQAFIMSKTECGHATTDYLQVTVGNPTSINSDKEGIRNQIMKRAASSAVGR